MDIVLIRTLDGRYTRSSIKEARRSAVSAIYAERTCFGLREVVGNDCTGPQDMYLRLFSHSAQAASRHPVSCMLVNVLVSMASTRDRNRERSRPRAAWDVRCSLLNEIEVARELRLEITLLASRLASSRRYEARIWKFVYSTP